MSEKKPILEWMSDQGVTLEALVESSGLDRRVVEAVVAGRYTTSPSQRQRLADALGLSPDAIRWGHAVQVDHLYGHGPQFGRSP